MAFWSFLIIFGSKRHGKSRIQFQAFVKIVWRPYERQPGGGVKPGLVELDEGVHVVRPPLVVVAKDEVVEPWKYNMNKYDLYLYI